MEHVNIINEIKCGVFFKGFPTKRFYVRVISISSLRVFTRLTQLIFLELTKSTMVNITL
jgi:hypothetical protein